MFFFSSWVFVVCFGVGLERGIGEGLWKGWGGLGFL